MSFGFNSQMGESKYAIQIETDNLEQFLFMQDMARECVDGKHKDKKNKKRASNGLPYCSCGGEPKIDMGDFYRSGIEDEYSIRCRECGKSVDGIGYSSVVEKWEEIN